MAMLGQFFLTMTSKWACWPLKSPASPLFTQPFIEVQINENIKAPSHWPLYGELTDSYLKWPCSANLCAFHWTLKFSMIGFAKKMRLRKSHYILKFGGMMQFTMKQIILWNGHPQLMFGFSDLGLLRSVTALDTSKRSLIVENVSTLSANHVMMVTPHSLILISLWCPQSHAQQSLGIFGHWTSGPLKTWLPHQRMGWMCVHNIQRRCYMYACHLFNNICSI